MHEQSRRMIDIFPHLMTPRVQEGLNQKARDLRYATQTPLTAPALFDLEVRFRDMDQFDGLTQVINVNAPVEYIVSPEDAVDLCKLANDEMAELVSKYPDRFVAAIACLPLNNIDAALVETDRAIEHLNFKGIRIHTSINSRPLDSPEFMDLYRKMESFDLPIWIHPVKDMDVPDYPGEGHSRYGMNYMLGWPYETSMAMVRLAASGVLKTFPKLKLITHHCGGMIPMFSNRLTAMLPRGEFNPEESLKMFYGDTVVHGSTAALMCGYSFFGAEHLLFGTDYPSGGGGIGVNIDAIRRMDIPQSDKERIFLTNAEQLLHLR